MLNLFKKPGFGIDISDFSIKVLELISKNKVKSFGQIKLEEGIVKDGFVPNKKKLVEKIKEIVSEAGIESNRAIVSLPESKVFIHIFKVPKKLKGEKLKERIVQEIAKTISLEPDKIYWDYQIVSIGKEKKEILYIGTLKEIVDAYQIIFKKAGLELIVFEVESIALERALSQSKDYFASLKTENKSKESRNILTIDIGSRITNINIFDEKHNLRMSSVVQAAGDNFTQVLVKSLKISQEEAEKLKRANGLNEAKDKGKIAEILKGELRPIIDAIKKALDSYDQKIGEILLVGGSALIPKIAEYFSSSLNIETNIGESFLAKELSDKNTKPVFFNTVVGLALRGLERNPGNIGLNLLPQTKKMTQPQRFWTGIVILAIIAFGFLGWVVMREKPVEEVPVVNEVILEELEVIEATSTPEEIIEEIEKVIISETETSWLNVREGAGTNYPVITKVYPGESYVFLEEVEEWYKIDLGDEKQGWIFKEYAIKQ